MTMNLINENADIKNFFEKKMCKDVCEYMCEFAKPHLFEVGDEIDVNFTWKDDYAEEYGNECNSYQISGIYRNKYCSEVYIYEITNGVSLIYENDEDDSQPKRLFIEKDSYGDEYISFNEFERDEEISYELLNYMCEAKDIDRK